uniref:Uncharacterized protein n=1 Tax=Cannabis sativa TaxID=3483 RepID=A0A803PYY4_CANSA
MPGGKGNIQSANPPSELKPNAISIIARLHKPEKKAEREPGQKQEEGGFQEQRLRLRELLYGVKLEDGLRKGHGVVVNSMVGGDGGSS